MPCGNQDPASVASNSFKPFTKDTLNKTLYGGNNVVWRAVESNDITASIRIEPCAAADTVGKFKVILTVFITEYTIFQATGLQAVVRLLAFLDSDRRQPQLVDYFFSVNQSLNRHLGVTDLSSIVFEFLLVR